MIGNGVVVDPAVLTRRDRRPAPPRHRRQRAAALGQRAPDHALPRDARHGGRGEARQARDRDDQARHRPLLRRQVGAPRDPGPGPARREDPAQEDRRRARAQAAAAAAVRARPEARPARDDRGVPALRPPARAAHRRHLAALLGGARRRARRSSSRAPRRRCSTSTTAPIRSSPPRTRSPARPASAPASGRPTSTRSGASARPTRPGSAPGRSRPSSPTRSAPTCAIAGHEFGTTTGRERRCGWLDLVALRYATRLNRLSALAITKLDVLSGLDPLRIAVRYRGKEGAVFDEFPYHQSILHTASAEYEEMPGWERGHHRRPQRGRPAARGARLPRRDLRGRRGPDQPRSASAPGASR